MSEIRLYRVSNNDQVSLSAFEFEMLSPDETDYGAFLHGKIDSFPAFEPNVRTQATEPDDAGDVFSILMGGEYSDSDARLIHFAHQVRPFPWSDDPRRDTLQNLVNDLTNGAEGVALDAFTTQDLWDALFIYARGERFVAGLIAAESRGLTAVANEIRHRLLAGRAGP